MSQVIFEHFIGGGKLLLTALQSIEPLVGLVELAVNVDRRAVAE